MGYFHTIPYLQPGCGADSLSVCRIAVGILKSYYINYFGWNRVSHNGLSTHYK